jgi:membrane-associated phospholipid phosphatase
LNDAYYLASAVLLGSFIVLAIVVSPYTGYDNSKGFPLIELDRISFLQINNGFHDNPFVGQLMVAMTEFGREVFWTVATLLIFIFGGRTGKKTATIIVLTMLSLVLIGTVAKELVGRQRPSATIDIPESDLLISPAQEPDFSFPSGHAVIVSAGSAITLTLFRGSTKKLVISLLLSTEAILVCVSRIYVGSHYPLDVLGGILLGVGVAFIFVGFQKRIESVLVLPLTSLLQRR